VIGEYKHRVGTIYKMHENNYNFIGLTFPTSLNEIKNFEKKNHSGSINVYGLKKIVKKQQNFTTHKVYPLKVEKEKKPNHSDLLLITENDKAHYTYIKHFSRPIYSQMTSHEHAICICKSCFAIFDSKPNKYKLHRQAALDQHR